MVKKLIPALVGVLLCACSSSAKQDLAEEQLYKDIRTIVSGHDAEIGVAAICEDDTIAFNNDESYPLMSVFKFHIALAALESAGNDALDMDSLIPVPYSRLRPGTYSPLRDDVDGRDTTLSVMELMRYSVGRSDNNACDILIDLCGGVEAVETAVRRIAADSITVLNETEESMHTELTRTYNNHTTPLALCSMMQKLYDGQLLDTETAKNMKTLLEGSRTGRDKIAAGVPEANFLGHKSGLSDRTEDGVLMGSADVAALSLPEGPGLYLAVMVKDAKESDERINPIFALISSKVFEYFANKHMAESKGSI